MKGDRAEGLLFPIRRKKGGHRTMGAKNCSTRTKQLPVKGLMKGGDW